MSPRANGHFVATPTSVSEVPRTIGYREIAAKVRAFQEKRRLTTRPFSNHYVSESKRK